jgi:hypothetical protein
VIEFASLMGVERLERADCIVLTREVVVEVERNGEKGVRCQKLPKVSKRSVMVDERLVGTWQNDAVKRRRR